MHRALSIGEVILAVADPDYLPKADISSFSRTCRRIWQFAEGRVWADLPNTGPLMQFLPLATHLVQASQEAITGRRFFHHSSLVRKLTLEFGVEESYLLGLASGLMLQHAPGLSIFPGLQSLHLAPSHWHVLGAAKCIPFLRWPTLHLSILLSWWDADTLVRLLKALAELHLRSITITLKIGIGHHAVSVQTAIERLFLDAPPFNMFTIGEYSLPIESFSSFASMPSAAAIHFSKCSDSTITLTRSTKPLLRILPPKLTAPELSHARSRRSAYDLVQLSRIPFVYCVIADELAIVDLHGCSLHSVIAALPSIVEKWSDTLHELHINQIKVTESHGTATFGDIVLLTQCKLLTEVTISSMEDGFRIDMDDEQFDGLITCWPGLRVLRLEDGPFSSASRRSDRSLRSIELIAKRCRSLQALSTAIDFDVGYCVSPPISASHLRLLDVGHSHCGNPRAVARNVRLLFPHLQHFAFKTPAFYQLSSRPRQDAAMRMDSMARVKTELGLAPTSSYCRALYAASAGGRG